MPVQLSSSMPSHLEADTTDVQRRVERLATGEGPNYIVQCIVQRFMNETVGGPKSN